MPLVDYASSSEEDEEVAEEEEEAKEHDQNPNVPAVPPVNDLHNRGSLPASPQPQSDGHYQSYISSIEKLPDASELLNSPVVSSHQIGGDHSSRVAAAMAESASRKRESNGSCASTQRGKHPRGNLPPSRISSHTVAGHLLPPQLTGRSNVVTEDIGKLFVSRHET